MVQDHREGANFFFDLMVVEVSKLRIKMPTLIQDPDVRIRQHRLIEGFSEYFLARLIVTDACGEKIVCVSPAVMNDYGQETSLSTAFSVMETVLRIESNPHDPQSSL
jgi:hypothetical protein